MSGDVKANKITQEAVYDHAKFYLQQFYDSSGDDFRTITSNQHVYLKNLIGFTLFEIPEEYEEEDNKYEDKAEVFKKKEQIKIISSIYEKIVKHGTQLPNKTKICFSIIHYFIYDKDSLSEYNIDQLPFVVPFVPIFKVKKCKIQNNKIIYRNWFVDTEGKVYEDWNDFLHNNNLPTCTMIAPKGGIYQADRNASNTEEKTIVWIETHNINPGKKIVNAVDIISTCVNVGCIGIGIAAMINPISAPFAIAGAVGGAVTGIWGGGRAAVELVDRGTHDQSLTDNNAIPAWIGLGGCTLGLAASGGSALLSRAIRTGTSVGKGAQIAYDVIMISNLAINAAGVGYNSIALYEQYKITGKVSYKDLFFLSANCLMFLHSVVKIKFAAELIRSGQSQILKDFEESLREQRHRKEFRRLVNNSESNEEIIRSLNHITDKDKLFEIIAETRNSYRSINLKLSFADGRLQINGNVMIDISLFDSMPNDSMVELMHRVSVNDYSRDLMSSKKLQGLSVIRQYHVKQNLSSGNIPTTKYMDLISDLQCVPKNSTILNLILDAAKLIAAKKITENYSEEQALADASDFIWNGVKTHLSKYTPDITGYNATCRDYIYKFVEATYHRIKTYPEEWAKTYNKYMEKRLPIAY